MKNIKSIFFSIFFLLISTQCKSEVKIAFIEMDKLINTSIAGKSLIKQLGEIDTQNRKSFDKKKKELNLKKDKINSQKNVLSKEEFEKKVTELNKEFEIYSEEGKNKIKSLESKKNNAMTEILSQINLILSKYSEENKLTFIIDQKNIVIGETDLNITKKIIKILDSQLKKISLK